MQLLEGWLQDLGSEQFSALNGALRTSLEAVEIQGLQVGDFEVLSVDEERVGAARDCVGDGQVVLFGRRR